MHLIFLIIKLTLPGSVTIYCLTKMIVACVLIVTAFEGTCVLSTFNFHCVFIVFVSIFRVKVLIENDSKYS